MDAFRLAAEMRHSHLNRIKTTKDIKVCKVADLPEPQGKKLSLRLAEHKHLDTGLCVMFHTTSGSVMEVRGYDEKGQEFSYKFHYAKSPDQPVAMRAVGADGRVKKLKVSLDEPTAKRQSVRVLQSRGRGAEE